MSIYRGFGLYRPTKVGHLTIHAQDVPETGAWRGWSNVGLMPDLKSAKWYIDYLHTFSPDLVPPQNVLEGQVDGHIVNVSFGRESDADPFGTLAAAAEKIRNGDLQGAFSDLVHAQRVLEFFAEQRGEARAVGNFIITSDGKSPRCRLDLGDQGFDTEWRGEGLIAVGIGDIWIAPLIERLSAKPISNFSTSGIRSSEDLSGYARKIFVEGDEPDVGPELIASLNVLQARLRDHLHFVWPVGAKAQDLDEIASVLELMAGPPHLVHGTDEMPTLAR